MGEDPSALVVAAAAGDSAAWNALVDRYTSLLWSVARGYRLDTADAADAVQTTWLRLVEHLGRIDDPSRVAGWLATTVRRECLRILRQSKREAPSSDDEGLPDRPDDADPLDAELLLAERDAALWRIFQQISERCRLLLRVLMASPPPSYSEVSAALDMPVGSIGPTRQRCLDQLRRLAEADNVLAEHGGPGERKGV
jgi:RNA polymerase sigma factor (sigma-70 family)